MQSPVESTCATGTSRMDLQSPARGLNESLVLHHFARLQGGEITLENERSGHTQSLGSPSDDKLQASLTVHQPAFFRQLVWGGELGLAESRMDGNWSSPDLTALLRIFCRNLAATGQMESPAARARKLLAVGRHLLSRNTVSGSRRNIATHYDLGNEFFSLFLDPSLMYSSALFDSHHSTLEEAQQNRLDRICRSLDLQPGDHLIEIGTGWGGFAIHAARHYGCHVTSTTISRQQYELADRRVREAGLTSQITLLQQDYRQLTGSYDRLVSIEMIEAVGHSYLPRYFATCRNLLRPGGRMLIQAITMPDQRYDSYRKSVDFIRRYIFPGGHLPSVTAMQQAVAKQTDLFLTSVEQFPESYARTLREWRRRFLSQLDAIRQLGFDDHFIRMWEYYLSYCEAAFLEKTVGVGHFIWDRPAAGFVSRRSDREVAHAAV